MRETAKLLGAELRTYPVAEVSLAKYSEVNVAVVVKYRRLLEVTDRKSVV